MMTVGQLAQHFLALEPQKNPARLAFYHFLKNFLPLQNNFGPEMIDHFYDRALSMSHWQVNKPSLGETLKADLQNIDSKNRIGFDLEQVVHAHEMQVITLEQNRDFSALISQDINKYEKSGEKVRLFRLNPEKNHALQEVLLLRINKSGQITAEVRQNTAILNEGVLQLVRPHSRLVYTADLEFDPNFDQMISTGLLRIARFRIQANTKVKGFVIQGSSFHCAESFDRPLEEVTEVFQAIKKMERFYVNPITDPYYQQIMDSIEI